MSEFKMARLTMSALLCRILRKACEPSHTLMARTISPAVRHAGSA